MITASKSVFNSGNELVLNDMTASQTVDIADVADEKVVLIVQNNNTGNNTTATVTIKKGDFGANVLGDLTVNVGKGKSAIVGPLEGVRFKNSASQLAVTCAVTASGTVSDVKLAAIKLP